MPILSLQDVHKDYLSDGEAVHALNGVSLDVARGVIRGLGGSQRLRKIHASESRRCDGLPEFRPGVGGWRFNVDSQGRRTHAFAPG